MGQSRRRRAFGTTCPDRSCQIKANSRYSAADSHITALGFAPQAPATLSAAKVMLRFCGSQDHAIRN